MTLRAGLLYHGDCLDVLSGIADDSIDAVVTDPPYSLGFMGKKWDSPRSFMEGPAGKAAAFDREVHRFQRWCEQWGAECLRVLKPGGHLLAFGAPRTYHRLTSGLEDAGFEIRDSIHWIYASGFPKGQDVGKAVRKTAGAERAVPWQGWNTALKPAHEPIVLARKTMGPNTMEAVMDRPAPCPRDEKGRLAPVFVEWMMGLLAGWVTAVPGLTRIQMFRLLGNGVVPQQLGAALDELLSSWREAVGAVPGAAA